jgi:hypothetical protein
MPRQSIPTSDVADFQALHWLDSDQVIVGVHRPR